MGGNPRAVIASSGAALPFAVASCAAPPAARVQRAEAPSPDHLRDLYLASSPDVLGSDYLRLDHLLQYVFPRVRAGTNLAVDTSFFGAAVTIDRSNVDRYERLAQELRATCSSVIEKRGYQSFAGTYAARANQACTDAVLPAYLTNISQLDPTASTAQIIRQDGFRVTMVAEARVKELLPQFWMHGAAIERMLMVDEVYSPILYVGTRSGRDIQFRPWTRGFAKYYEAHEGRIPSARWSALGRCVIALFPPRGAVGRSPAGPVPGNRDDGARRESSHTDQPGGEESVHAAAPGPQRGGGAQVALRRAGFGQRRQFRFRERSKAQRQAG